ncbi:protein singed wings 2 [Aricia agestis]|uniref:protein singed wings 2 n=1 Tax=Aricia agestis TaxID=91739 RepID=UPI001C20A75F|nr:protein singed wings 2 [Aricia agestis]
MYGLRIIMFILMCITRTNTKNYLQTECSLSVYSHGAHCNYTKAYLVCKNGISSYWLQANKRLIKHLQIVSWPGPCLNVDHLELSFPHLEILDIINSTILRTFKGKFNQDSNIQTLSMHGLPHLWEIEPEVIAEMKELRLLNLTGNGLRHMKENFVKSPLQLEKVFLANNKWDCSNGGLDWLAMEKESGRTRTRVKDYYRILCHHQLYKGKPLHTVMDIIKMVRETCPQPCACAMTHVVSDAAGTVIPLITVDCARRRLTEPPAALPPNSTTLRLEGNKISTIRHLVQNPQYRRLMDLYLDNNTIHSIKELEGTEWFTTFRVLSLRGNLLKQIPVYAFDKAFQSNNNIMNVYLGHNPWRCDCHFIPRFQGLLLKYKRVIRDLPDIRCSKSDDKTISLVQISTMPLGNVCHSEMELPISPINIVNIVLLACLLLVVGRFLYDWHRFKTTGQLPWISKILP